VGNEKQKITSSKILFSRKTIFNPASFRRGQVLVIAGYDDELEDITGTYFIKKVEDDRLDLDGYTKEGKPLSPWVYVSDIEDGRINFQHVVLPQIEMPIILEPEFEELS
jgi:hypothetical protein